MTVFSCFAAAEYANALLFVFGEVPKNGIDDSKEIRIANVLRYAHNILLYKMQSARQSTKFDLVKV